MKAHNSNLAGDVIGLMQRLLHWQPEIEDAMRRVNYMYTFNDVVESILRQQRIFYEFDDCMIIMQIDPFPQWKAFHCFLACGTTEAILAAEPKMHEIAKVLDCKYLSISGRVGWPRRLKSEGWKHLISTLYKEVE